MNTETTPGRWRSRVPIAVVAALASASIAVAAPGAYHADGHTDAEVARSGPSAKHAVLHDAMRKLWEDHITWTRLFIVSAVADLPDRQATTARLLRNQKHIGNAIKPYYGKTAGNQLTKLLTEHILIAADILAAAKAGDDAGVKEHSDRWYRNANQIGNFLGKANPKHWPRAEMRSMMREHLDLTLTEAVAHLTNDHSTDVRTYDRIHIQILSMADMLSDGIAAQFPKRFR